MLPWSPCAKYWIPTPKPARLRRLHERREGGLHRVPPIAAGRDRAASWTWMIVHDVDVGGDALAAALVRRARAAVFEGDLTPPPPPASKLVGPPPSNARARREFGHRGTAWRRRRSRLCTRRETPQYTAATGNRCRICTRPRTGLRKRFRTGLRSYWSIRRTRRPKEHPTIIASVAVAEAAPQKRPGQFRIDVEG